MSTPGSVPPRTTLPALLSPVVVLLGYAAMGSAAAVAMLAARRGHPLGLRSLLMASELALIVPALLVLLLMRRPIAASLGLRAVDRTIVGMAICAGAALWAASLGLLEVQSSIWPPNESFLETFRQLHAALRPHGVLDALFSVAAIAAVPALCEEILFRGVVLPALVRPFGAIGAVLTSALLFGVIHLDFGADGAAFFTRIPFAIMVGVGLGLLRVRTGSLLPPAIAHAVLNAITFATVVVTGAEVDETPDPALGMAMLLGGVVLSAIALRQARPPLTGPDADPRLV